MKSARRKYSGGHFLASTQDGGKYRLALEFGRDYDEGLDGRFVTVKEAARKAPTLRRDALVIVSHWFEELKGSVK